MRALVFLLVLGIAAFAGSATAWFGLGFWVEALGAAAVAIAGVFWGEFAKREPQANAAMMNSTVARSATRTATAPPVPALLTKMVSVMATATTRMQA